MIRTLPWPILAAPFLLCVAAIPAAAQSREYCPDRPGLGTSACTIDVGHVSVETGLADWRHDATPDETSDRFLFGDTLLRIGISGSAELQWQWTPVGRIRTRDSQSGAVDRSSGVGDMLIGAKANLRHPGGDGFSIALQPFVTIPVGKAPTGEGNWTAGLVVPLEYDIGRGWSVGFSGEADALPDTNGRGRHLAYSGTLGVEVEFGDGLSGAAEFQASRDDDPSGWSSQALAALSLAWMVSADLQFDIGGIIGLAGSGPCAGLSMGISRSF